MSHYGRIKLLLEQHGLSPNKRFGQNFLVDPSVAPRIVALAGIKAGDRVLEIGPGVGSLTIPLLQKAGAVTAVEKDRKLLPLLRVEAAGVGALTLVEEDALLVDYTALAQQLGGPLKLAANLPYNISTPLMVHLLDHHAAFECMALMFQKEVAQRLAAEPGSKAYGALTVQCALWAEIRHGFDVPPAAFLPAPKVTSAVVHVQMMRQPRVAVEDERHFVRVVKAAFAQRRKTLRNTLKTICPDPNRWLEQAGIDGALRAEVLTLAQFAQLANTPMPTSAP
ncbi:dimethyladenosine transferase [Magnetococcus marinus MC-1]|uniref:Ribosomal RNA small subunit methyltransferase A n=1 Tax=Magnetococcus marinus (strain ATCC BAA-1437 / JCM 17883 / MC-1) TaxID=156889 RepID=RSMA_MAGMM|nr:16S rRNA (adenine(1518)-N(6)/adenine(1519)-N(6))-dimethyltransferase RsmA [Magnetococcus marinus]A0LA32.1 RecName: Full=Ribosomal RNA small subunit methyltransferase A; AltName: Full=16S rRNA (adenine(1518)-N(6)/adenine(1519)-N(6))-dimethyltransferase; AltName: Full=16S rRNA dimethyladenosine transferase; AltName: Full=16S rRNA dimethylase; AltName: Full=S-adenosylmethionine-6-N', N'-adenosyl(rRNA) dimethyltransferase [Magnetococcus marinus MC-1]ABK44825.1 dimethyladenosine transferase [Magnet